MNEYNSNIIKPVDGLHSISSVTGVRGRQERKRKQKNKDKQERHISQQKQDNQNTNDYEEDHKENICESDSIGIDYRA